MTTSIIENSTVVLLARVLDSAGEPITPTSIASIAVRIFDADAGDEVTPAPSVEVADAVHETLQQGDARWTVDGTGFNVEVVLAGANFPNAATYQVELRFTPVTGPAFYAVFQLQATPLFSE